MTQIDAQRLNSVSVGTTLYPVQPATLEYVYVIVSREYDGSGEPVLAVAFDTLAKAESALAFVRKFQTSGHIEVVKVKMEH